MLQADTEVSNGQLIGVAHIGLGPFILPVLEISKTFRRTDPLLLMGLLAKVGILRHQVGTAFNFAELCSHEHVVSNALIAVKAYLKSFKDCSSSSSSRFFC